MATDRVCPESDDDFIVRRESELYQIIQSDAVSFEAERSDTFEDEYIVTLKIRVGDKDNIYEVAKLFARALDIYPFMFIHEEEDDDDW